MELENRYNSAYDKLSGIGQAHLLKFFDELNTLQKEQLLFQIEKSDFSVIKHLKDNYDNSSNCIVEPIKAMTVNQIQQQSKQFEKVGIEAIKKGEVAAVLLAGGQGTRLGVDKSKGMVNIGRSRDLYIFECLFNNTLEVVKKAKAWIPFYIMTSAINNDEIIEFLHQHKFFGYNGDYVHFFIQEMLPVLDFDGKFMLESKDSLCLSPNGNGGWFSSLYNSGLYQELIKNGAKWLNCFSVDNVLQRIADPLFIGATIKSKVDCGSKVIRKNFLDEKVGHICLKNSKPSIIEYYEMTSALLNQKNDDGSLAFNFGVTLNYLFKIDKLEYTLKTNLPIHVVKKKVNHIDSNGKPITPTTENGYKFETLILDMVEMLGTCLPYEVIRENEFAPIKNKEGVDSIQTAQELLIKNNIII